MWIANGWKDYEVIDTSSGEKLERWGDYMLVRPDPQVIWKTDKKHFGWKKWNGHYHRSSKGGGEWEKRRGMPEEWKKPGLYRCGMTGALTLVKRKVFEAGVSYEKIPNIHTALRGEDRHFCVRAACAGFELWIDSHCPANHLYTRQLYDQYMAERR